MKIFSRLDELEKIHHGTGIALGTFDGFHLGHQKVIRTLVEKCKERHLKSVLFTFSNHPREIVNSGSHISRIITIDDKVKLAEEMGIDYLVILKFDKAIMSIEARDFIENLLIDTLNAKLLSVGYNFRFGHKASGDVQLLKNYRDIFELIVTEAVYEQEYNVSSTIIRELLEDGNIEKANRLLGRHYKLVSNVVKGKELGKQIGFPTANLHIYDNMTRLKPGVYVTISEIDGVEYKSVTNVGFNPTFDETKFNVETHILEFDGNIYGKELTVKFLKRIRDEFKFPSVDELVIQIGKDVCYAKEYFANILSLS